MPKLHEINALTKGKKAEQEKLVGDLYKIIQQPGLFTGRIRTYKHTMEGENESQPTETQRVQYKAWDLAVQAFDKWRELLAFCGTQDLGNQHAKADIEIDGTVLVKDVPVTTLLLLEKVSTDMETFVSKLPIPDPGENWDHDPNQDLLKSGQVQTNRTRKVPKNHVLSPATDKHPAQVQVYNEDVIVGHYYQTLFSGAIPAAVKNGMLKRARALKDAVKLARERANTIEVTKVDYGKAITEFILGTSSQAA